MIQDRILKLRKERKLTQTQLAEAIGKGQSSINAYEKGDRRPSYEVLCRIADFFNVSTDYLLGRTNVPECPSNIHAVNSEINSVIIKKKADPPTINEKSISSNIASTEDVQLFERLKPLFQNMIDQAIDDLRADNNV